ncbi:MAG: universal stress protein [Candidatus Thorarchaeota archaeon]|nr:universal stress protein [Candidatus Thorarchaeota archaeon]
MAADDRVLMPVSGTIEYADMVAALMPLLRFHTKNITLFHVVETPVTTPLESSELDKTLAGEETKLKPMADWLTAQGYNVETRIAVARHTVDAIVEETYARGYSLIFMMKRRKRSLSEKLLGRSVTEEVIRRVKTPVVTILV